MIPERCFSLSAVAQTKVGEKTVLYKEEEDIIYPLKKQLSAVHILFLTSGLNGDEIRILLKSATAGIEWPRGAGSGGAVHGVAVHFLVVQQHRVRAQMHRAVVDALLEGDVGLGLQLLLLLLTGPSWFVVVLTWGPAEAEVDGDDHKD